MTTARVVVIGYASLDYPMELAEFHGADATSVVTARLGTHWPGIGGSAYLAKAAYRAGAEVGVVSWVGSDAHGGTWTDALSRLGVDCSAVAVTGTRSPSSYLFYTPSQGTVCVFDAGDCHDTELSPLQRTQIRDADWCLIAVGPAAASQLVLEILPQDARLAWAVKQDVSAFPPDLIAALLARAALVSLSESEREFLTENGTGPEQRCSPGSIIVETRGSRGVAFTRANSRGEVETGTIEVVPVVGADTTGAGDTFAGTLTALLAKTQNPSRLSQDELEGYMRTAANAATSIIRGRVAATDGTVALFPQEETPMHETKENYR